MKEFISLKEFVSLTGVVVFPFTFREVKRNFKKSGVSIEEFVKDYEKKYCMCIMTFNTLKGKFKFYKVEIPHIFRQLVIDWFV